ncbi:MAG: hypothetical protein M9888_06040 [Chitinophagales bacterium]|nr:hypothetical protein [Chitinophagales bacterium]
MKVQSSFQIKGIVSSYPKQVILTDNMPFNSISELSIFKRKIGVLKRRSSSGKLTAKDLGTHAIKNLLDGLKWKAEEIGLLINVTQTPDYSTPGNSYLYQKELEFPDSCFLMDLNVGCTGFIQSLLIALAQGDLLNTSKIIIVCGDTDILTSTERQESNKLMGDAVCAIALEAQNKLLDYTFSFQTNGSDFQSIYSENSFARSISKDSSHLLSPVIQMNGGLIFNYITQIVIPKLKNMELSLETPSQIHFLHQPNLMYYEYIIKKMGWDFKQAPTCIQDFGNVSSAMIPLIIQKNKHLLQKNQKSLLVSFGVGLSFIAAQIELSHNLFTNEVECE